MVEKTHQTVYHTDVCFICYLISTLFKFLVEVDYINYEFTLIFYAEGCYDNFINTVQFFSLYSKLHYALIYMKGKKYTCLKFLKTKYKIIFLSDCYLKCENMKS